MAPSILTIIGLQAAGAQQPPNYAPAFTIANWFFAYCTLSTRFSKISLGIDHNTSPREDLSKYGDAAVRAGKLSQRRLEQIRRMQSAHENSVEGFTLFVAAVVFATYGGVPNATVNGICVWYTLSRLAYGAAYIWIESRRLSMVRSAIWWSCNASCITGLVLAGRAL
ncbi:MAG: hypothetical protein Q9161_001533 [Pseudevernia consocians]